MVQCNAFLLEIERIAFIHAPVLKCIGTAGAGTALLFCWYHQGLLELYV
jgi:hypothetical protein